METWPAGGSAAGDRRGESLSECAAACLIGYMDLGGGASIEETPTGILRYWCENHIGT